MGELQSLIPEVCDPKSDASLDTLIGLATDYAGYTERDARYLIDKVDRIYEAGTWPRRLEDEPKTWGRFCATILGYDAGYFDRIREGIQVLEQKGVLQPSIAEARAAAAQQQAENHKTIGNHPGPAPGSIAAARAELVKDAKGDGAPILCNTNNRCTSSVDTSYLTARIARDRPDILDRMKAGEYRSVRAAAIDAGIVKPRLQAPDDPEKLAAYLLRKWDRERIAVLLTKLADALT